jgi:hypothetical protein
MTRVSMRTNLGRLGPGHLPGLDRPFGTEYNEIMSVHDTIREMLHREPFQSFRVVTSSGRSYVVHNPDFLALLRSAVFIAQPNSDEHAFVPLLHVTAVETAGNGRKAHRRK